MSAPASALIRDPAALASWQFDVVIVGGGINGAYCLLDAQTRGLKAALIESHDFGCATSSNSAKVAHSGVRYLQHGDLKRLRKSARERANLFANAPHLMEHVSVLMPVRGHGVKGRETVRAYTAGYDLLSRDLRKSEDPQRAVPTSSMLSRDEALKACPLIPESGLSGGAVWPEGLVTNTERLVIGVLRAASELGGFVANAMRADGLLRGDKGAACGVQATDKHSGESLEIRARAVVDATGPLTGWSGINSPVPLARAFGLVTRSICESHVLAFPIPPTYRDADALVDRGETLQFAVPWRGRSLIGTMHLPLEGEAADAAVTEGEIALYLDAINQALPKAKLQRDDVERVLWGVLPCEEAGSPSPAKQGRVIAPGDAARFYAVAGVKLTEARALAEETLDRICVDLGEGGRSATASQPIWGGDVEQLADLHAQASRELAELPGAVAARLIQHYGTRYGDVLACADEDDGAAMVKGSNVLVAEIRHAIRCEQALTLADVVLRRTDMGSAGEPSDAALEGAAQIMAKELGWDAARIASEIAAVRACANYGAAGGAPSLRAAAD